MCGRAADAAGNAAQALDACAILGDRLGDKVVPIDARAHAEKHAIAGGVLYFWGRYTADGNLQHQSGPTGISDDEVASSAEDK